MKQSDEHKVDIHNMKTLYEKLHELQEAIGLTDDELALIAYTSIDHDNLNNLIILAGEFMLWFNLNFEGESREEIDFRENKCEIWVSTGVQAKMIIDAYAQMDPKNHKDVLTKYWWEHNRYSRFADAMAQKFAQQPELMQNLRHMFAVQKDKLSYFDFFQFVQHTLEI